MAAEKDEVYFLEISENCSLSEERGEIRMEPASPRLPGGQEMGKGLGRRYAKCGLGPPP